MDRRRVIGLLPRGGAASEIGTWRGDYAAAILRRRPSLLHLIDPWQHRAEPKYEVAWYGRTQQHEMDSIYEAVLARFAANITAGQVVVHRARSIDAAATLDDASLDWVYIDGDHTYEGVIADLEAYSRLVKPGGVIAGDDYGVPGWWGDGVTRAVDEFASRCGALTIVGDQFVLRKR